MHCLSILQMLRVWNVAYGLTLYILSASTTAFINLISRSAICIFCKGDTDSRSRNRVNKSIFFWGILTCVLEFGWKLSSRMEAERNYNVCQLLAAAIKMSCRHYWQKKFTWQLPCENWNNIIIDSCAHECDTLIPVIQMTHSLTLISSILLIVRQIHIEKNTAFHKWKYFFLGFKSCEKIV